MVNVYSLGGSKHIGYFAALRLLDAGYTFTFLLRNPSALQNDQAMSKHIAARKVFLVKGDALVKSDVENGWNVAGKHGPVDLMIFSVGGRPSLHITRGFVLDPPNLVTQCLLNAITTIPKNQSQPKIVAISSNGLTKTSHETLPCLLKPYYAYLLANPHQDKVGLERVLHHVAGWKWNSEDDGEPEESILSPDWTTQTPGLPDPGSLKQTLVVRPALLTDGECQADRKGEMGYKLSEGDLGGWTVSRRDVAHFVADAVLNKWEQYVDKIISISY
ncbi:hypothetical protein V5O48_016613 [Marasmius crinis-equi]|uniref:NAD(P)-binding domain-containing protein n=1 Tax=Marasmius crinis-equi TaxID=585013 RepID=A0ABR3ERH1_9AGAR